MVGAHLTRPAAERQLVAAGGTFVAATRAPRRATGCTRWTPTRRSPGWSGSRDGGRRDRRASSGGCRRRASATFVARCRHPMAIGRSRSPTARSVSGFLCRARRRSRARRDITACGGWRAYRAAGTAAVRMTGHGAETQHRVAGGRAPYRRSGPAGTSRRGSRSSTRPPRCSPSRASRRPRPVLIAERVGIRQASLYYHFAGKDDCSSSC